MSCPSFAYIPRQGVPTTARSPDRHVRGDRSSVKAITWQDHACHAQCARMMIVSPGLQPLPRREACGDSLRRLDVGTLGRAHCFLRCSKLELRWRGEMRTAWVCSASLLDHLLSNTHVIVFVKPVLSSLEVGASRVLGLLGGVSRMLEHSLVLIFVFRRDCGTLACT